MRAATGYGSRYVRAQELAGDGLHDRGVGTLSVEDRWQIAEGVTATVGGRFSYVGFLGDTNHFDPSASLEIQGADRTTFRGSVYARTVAPGGDILTLNTLASAPAMNFAGAGRRAARGAADALRAGHGPAARRDLGRRLHLLRGRPRPAGQRVRRRGRRARAAHLQRVETRAPAAWE